MGKIVNFGLYFAGFYHLQRWLILLLWLAAVPSKYLYKFPKPVKLSPAGHDFAGLGLELIMRIYIKGLEFLLN